MFGQMDRKLLKEKQNMRSASAAVIPDLIHPDNGQSLFLERSKMSSVSHSRMPTI
jgi:hypothetical protein